MGNGTGLFWIGKGTLGSIRQNEEIPEGAISPERIDQLMKQKLIGKKIKPVDDTTSKLMAENIALRKKLEEKKASGKKKEAKVKK